MMCAPDLDQKEKDAPRKNLNLTLDVTRVEAVPRSRPPLAARTTSSELELTTLWEGAVLEEWPEMAEIGRAWVELYIIPGLGCLCASSLLPLSSNLS